MNEAEIKAQENMARIVKVTNPFDFEYTHAWGGIPYTLPVGKSLLFPYPLANHLATHLARQALIRKAPTRDANEVDGKGKDRPLWSEESIEELKKTIMVEQYTEERKAPVSAEEEMRLKIEALNKQFADLSAKVEGKPAEDGGNAPLVEPIQGADVPPEALETASTASSVADAPATTADAIGYKDKGEVMAELKKRGIAFDARKGKVELEKLLATPPEAPKE